MSTERVTMFKDPPRAGFRPAGMDRPPPLRDAPPGGGVADLRRRSAVELGGQAQCALGRRQRTCAPPSKTCERVAASVVIGLGECGRKNGARKSATHALHQ